MGSCISTANPREQDSAALSTSNNPTAAYHQSQQPVSSPTFDIQREQPDGATIEPKNEFLNDTDERFSITSVDGLLIQTESPVALIKKLQLENEDLKIKQTVADEKSKHLEVYQVMVNELKAKCADKEKQLIEKDAQLAEKDQQLADNAHLIELLQAKVVENEKQLQSKSNDINQLQAKCDEKDARLADNSILIEKLKVDCAEKDCDLVEKDKQLQSKSSEIDKLQEACSNKDSQLNEKTKLADKLQADCVEKDKQIKATFDRFKGLGNCLHDSDKLVDALWNCGFECWNQKQYIESLVYYDNAIDLEKATQNRASKLARLFGNRASCFNRLKQHQRCIDAANLALQYDSNDKYAWNNRGAAYEYLKLYSNARQDYEKTLQLDPNFELARNNLNRVQEFINASTSQ